MDNNSNFLLKIHMEEENTTEIFLNKEKHTFTFVNDDCVSDLIVPEFKITSLNMMLCNVVSTEGDDKIYAEYVKDNQTVREYDRDKVNILKDLVTKINISDFIDCIENIKINDFYVDSIVDKYNVVLPKEVQKIVSYTTNGTILDGSNIYYLMSHEDIMEYNGLRGFVPFLIKNGKNYIGYDSTSSTYKEMLGDVVISEAPNLKELVLLEKQETVENNETDEDDVTLNEIRKGVIDALNAIEEDEEEDDEALEEIKLEETLAKVRTEDPSPKIENISLEEGQVPVAEPVTTEEVVEEEIIDTSNESEISTDVVAKNKIEEDTDEGNAENVVIESNEEQMPVVEPVITEETTEEKVPDEIEEINLEDTIAKINVDEIIDSSEESENDIVEEPVIEEIEEENNSNTNTIDSKEILSLNNLINNAIANSFDNYQINFNDTGELVVEHLPYYELPKQFDVITIPEVEIDKITLLPNNDIDFGKFKLTVTELTDNKVTFTVKSSSSIVLEDGTKVKKGDTLTLDLKTTLDLRLKKKDVMETWSLRMEKSTFEKELRNIDYNRIMNYIYGLDAYRDLEYIEKYELQKSVMLFIEFVMRDNEEDKLEELYHILVDEPTLYEEFITNYNVSKAIDVKDKLNTYEDKKEFVAKLNYITGLSKAKWLDYPRYIFASHDYFSYDEFLQEFCEELENSVAEEDFAIYLKHLFEKYGMFKDLDFEGQENLDNCLSYLSKLYKYHPDIGENNKYRIEKEFMTGATEEDMALLISKLCRRGIKDYASFVEYDRDMKEKYRLGELKYPIFSPEFGDCDMRKDGENDEF